MKHNKRFTALAENAKQQVQETDIATVKRMMDQGEDFNLVDVREESEWAQGHLPHATHMSKGVIERDIETKIPDTDATIVLYCGGGFRSALTAVNLKMMGYTKVISMDGGFKAWQAAGYDIKND